MNVVLPIVVLAALIAATLVARERLRVHRAVTLQRRLRAAAATAAVPLHPQTPGSSGTLLAHPEQGTGWIVTTPDGWCTEISPSALALLGVSPAPTPVALAGLLAGGDRAAATMWDELRATAELADRVVYPARSAAGPVDLAGVALRDRDGNTWGAMLIIRRAQPTSSRPPP